VNPRFNLRFSHMGFHVTDVDRMARFYKDVLGFTETDRGPLDTPLGRMTLVFLSRDPDEHHQIVLLSGRPDNLSFNVINQISLRADSLEALQGIFAGLRELAVTDLVGVTHGNAFSVYFKDPEGNRIELYVDSPWYVAQPCRVEAPLHLPAPEFLAWAEAQARGLPGFRPRAEWRAEMARRMEQDAPAAP
jgi:catechol-2,3-dioxygenase